jgi:hypothetical protein
VDHHEAFSEVPGFLFTERALIVAGWIIDQTRVGEIFPVKNENMSSVERASFCRTLS